MRFYPISKLDGDFKKSYRVLIGANQRDAWPLFVLAWLDLDGLLGCASLVGEARLGLVAQLTD